MSAIPRLKPATIGLLAALAVAVAAIAAWAASSAKAVPCLDRTAPSLSVGVSPQTLMPPDSSLREIAATVKVLDDCDPAPTVWLASITASGPDVVNPPKAGPDVQDAAFGTLDLAFRLRAERDGDGTSRIYAITYAARDHAGNTATKHAAVVVSGLPGVPG
jgi:hypothetical protein